MKFLKCMISSLLVCFSVTGILCYSAYIITTYDFLQPQILRLVLGCIFLLLAGIWTVFLWDISDYLHSNLYPKRRLRKNSHTTKDNSQKSSMDCVHNQSCGTYTEKKD